MNSHDLVEIDEISSIASSLIFLLADGPFSSAAQVTRAIDSRRSATALLCRDQVSRFKTMIVSTLIRTIALRNGRGSTHRRPLERCQTVQARRIARSGEARKEGSSRLRKHPDFRCRLPVFDPSETEDGALSQYRHDAHQQISRVNSIQREGLTLSLPLTLHFHLLHDFVPFDRPSFLSQYLSLSTSSCPEHCVDLSL